MCFVAVKSAEQQSVLVVHRTRVLLVRQRTMLVNAMRAHLAEFGVVARVGLPQQLLSLEGVIVKSENLIHAWPGGTKTANGLRLPPASGG